LLEEAEKIDSESEYIKLTKSKFYTYIGKYNEARMLMDNIEFDKLSNLKNKNIYLTRFADLLKRTAELENKDFYDQKLIYYKEAIKILERSPKPDKQLTIMYISILDEMCFSIKNNKELKFLLEKISEYYKEFNKYYIFKTLTKKVLRLLIIYPIEDKAKYDQYLVDYDKLSSNMHNENEGIVSKLIDNYGFIKNSNYPGGLYFNLFDCLYDIQIGDKVKYCLGQNKIGVCAVKISKLSI